MMYGGHNPYFNRWFSAIKIIDDLIDDLSKVTILILIDGFLQCHRGGTIMNLEQVTILILIDGFLQFRALNTNSWKLKKSQSLF